MSFLRRTMAFLAISLLTSLSAGALWSIEIDCIEGRPWDSGKVEVDRNSKQSPTFHKDLSFRTTLPGIDEPDRERRDKSFDKFLNHMFSFLNP